MLHPVATREARSSAGRRRGEQLSAVLLEQLRVRRVVGNLSLPAVAHEMSWSHERYRRFESGRLDGVSMADLAAAGAVLGLDMSAAFHPRGDGIRDAGQQALAKRFRAVLGEAWRVAAEVLLPGVGDRRAWDLVLRLAPQRVGVELETRVRDVQWLVRRMLCGRVDPFLGRE